MQKQADVNMTFESFVALYEKDIKPKLKLNTSCPVSSIWIPPVWSFALLMAA